MTERICEPVGAGPDAVEEGIELDEGRADVFEGVTLDECDTLETAVDGTDDALAAPGMH